MFFESVPPDHILVLVEITIQNLAYIVAVDVICVDEVDEHTRFVKRHSFSLAIGSATTVAVKRDPNQVYPPVRIDVEIGKNATTLEAQAKAAWPGACPPNVF
jgi:hypothetical protein